MADSNLLSYLAISFGSPKTVINYINENVRDGDDESVRRVQKFEMNFSQSVGITGALLATVTATSLQLPNLPNIHWIVSAIWTVTLIYSLLSVYTSLVMYRSLATFQSALSLRKYYSGSKVPLGTFWLKSSTGVEYQIIGNPLVFPAFDPSFTARHIAMPSLLLDFALLFYLIALGLYCLLSGVEMGNPDHSATPKTTLKVFAFYLAAVVGSLGLFFASDLVISLNSEFNRDLANPKLETSCRNIFQTIEARLANGIPTNMSSNQLFQTCCEEANRGIEKEKRVATYDGWIREVEGRLDANLPAGPALTLGSSSGPAVGSWRGQDTERKSKVKSGG